MRLVEIAKWIIVLIAAFNFGGLIADALVSFTVKQHVRNPAWPPRAKFHNGQTMLMGLLSGSLSLAILFIPRALRFRCSWSRLQ